MVSVWFERSRRDTACLTATMTLGRGPGDARVVDVDVRSVGRRGVVLDTDAIDPEARHAWLEIDLPGTGPIRPLVELGHAAGGHTPARFKHLFPSDAALLEAFHARMALSTGY